jgi:hypothetical protein
MPPGMAEHPRKTPPVNGPGNLNPLLMRCTHSPRREWRGPGGRRRIGSDRTVDGRRARPAAEASIDQAPGSNSLATAPEVVSSTR